MFGKPVIKGTRITVEIILEKLANGETEEEIIKDYPIIAVDDIKACLIYTANRISLEEIITV